MAKTSEDNDCDENDTRAFNVHRERYNKSYWKEHGITRVGILNELGVCDDVQIAPSAMEDITV